MQEANNRSDAERIASLEGQVQQLMELLKLTTAAKVEVPQTKEDVIKIVHLVECGPDLRTIIKLSNVEINMTSFGEERTLSVAQFEELVGKYRSWFKSGVIAVHGDYEDKARFYGLQTTKNYPVKSDFMNSIGSKTMEQIENVYKRLPEAGRLSINGLFLREARAGNPKFCDIRKLEVMNRLSDGAFTQVIAEITRKNQNK